MLASHSPVLHNRYVIARFVSMYHLSSIAVDCSNSGILYHKIAFPAQFCCSGVCSAFLSQNFKHVIQCLFTFHVSIHGIHVMCLQGSSSNLHASCSVTKVSTSFSHQACVLLNYCEEPRSSI